MTEAVLEQIVIKLSCRAFELEADRDHWRNQAESLQEQLAQSQSTLTDAFMEQSAIRRRLTESQRQLHHHQTRQVEVDYQLRAIALAASVTEASLQAEGRESRFVKDTLYTLQEIVKKNDVRSTLLSVRKSCPDRHASLPSPACRDSSTSESD